jgi:hypothetical protein
MRIRALSVFAVMLLVSLLACEKKTESAATETAAPTTTTAAPAAAPAAEASTAATAPAATTSANPSALASADGEASGTRLEVTELKRTSGGTLNLKFTMINDTNERLDFGYRFAEKGFADISAVHLIDQTGKKKYFVARDAEGNCVCSSGLKDMEKGERRNLWAKFPAPPAEVKMISIVVPHFSPMDDVPISE